jgi:hypothetical protein
MAVLLTKQNPLVSVASDAGAPFSGVPKAGRGVQ